MASNADPDTILFAQHGWADTGGPIASLARAVAPPNTRIVAPNLGLLKTWFRIEPLIARLETIAAEHLNACPDAPIRIIGHSMGGVIWLEVLQRHPEWWPRVASFVLIGSPVGGSDVGRLLDPLGLGIGIARDLGYNRREIAERIAAAVPTISIAGDLHDGTDGLVPLEATRFAHARWIILKGLSHPILRTHPRVANAIREIWYEHSSPAVEPECALHVALRQRLQSVPGMTDAHSRHCLRGRPLLTFQNGTHLRTWRNRVGVDHVYLIDAEGACHYAGYVGWKHAPDLRAALAAIQKDFADALANGHRQEEDSGGC